MEQISVTVGMVVHNHPAGLRRSVPTVFAQTWQGPLRLVVLDDGSTDETPRALAALARHYPGLEVVRNAVRRGRRAALGQALDLAGDDYLAWLEPGDLWHPRKLELQLAALRRAEQADPAAPLVGTCPLRRVTPAGADVVDASGAFSTLVGEAAHLRAARHQLVGPADSVALCTRVEPGTGSRPHGTTAGGLARMLRPALRMLRNAGAAGLVRRVGPLRRLATSERLRAFRQEPTVRAGDIEALEAEISAAGARAQPRAWLRLEQAYRLCGRFHSAESTLRRALDQHPDDPQLTIRLIELLPLRRKWAEAAKLWAGLDAAGRRPSTGLTYGRVARSLRELDDAAGALAVAEEGAARFAHEPELVAEVHANRAALVNWAQAVRPVDAAPNAAQPSQRAGVVTSLGFLTGGAGPVEGRLADPGGGTARVSLVVNGRPVATTGAAPGPQGATFSLACHAVREFLGDGDVISVECDGQPLAIDGHGLRCEVATGYESRFGELERRLAAGHVFTKFGVLAPGNTPQRKQDTLALFRQVAAVVAESAGHVAYPLYGNLLGAVRDHDFIGHDVGGFDMGYVSGELEPAQVRQEFLRICRALVDHGFRLRLEPWSVYVRRHGGEAYVDLNYAWFNERGELGLSFGWRYQPVTDREHFFHPREGLIAGQLAPVPGNAEAVLEQLYGSTWAIPEQGFAVEAGLQRDQRRLLTRSEQEELFAYAPDQVLIRSILAGDGHVIAYPGG